MSISASLQQALVNKQKFSTFTNKEGMTLKLHIDCCWELQTVSTFETLDKAC